MAAAPRSVVSVPPLPLIGTVGSSPQTAGLDRQHLPSQPDPSSNPRGVAGRRRGTGLAIGLLPVVVLGAVAIWGWRSPDRAWGHLPTSADLVVGGMALLYLALWGVFRRFVSRPDGTKIDRAAQPPAPSLQPAPSLPPAPPPWQAPAVITAIPGMGTRSDPSVERTQVPPQRRFLAAGPADESADPPTAPPTSSWSVVLDDGRTVPLDRPAVFGRDPAALPGEDGMELRPIADQTRTVSKTHVKLEPGSDSVLVTDRHSTNGVVVITAGIATRCRAGEPMVATQGSVVRFGDREMQVRRR